MGENKIQVYITKAVDDPTGELWKSHATRRPSAIKESTYEIILVTSLASKSPHQEGGSKSSHQEGGSKSPHQEGGSKSLERMVIEKSKDREFLLGRYHKWVSRFKSCRSVADIKKAWAVYSEIERVDRTAGENVFSGKF